MKCTYLVSWAFALLAVAGPVPESTCSEECFSTTNECNISYGGCYDTCTGGERPTFTVPACPTTPTLTTTGPPEITITPAPTPMNATITGACIAQTICLDGVWKCGNETGQWGGCYDTCGTSTPVSPSCSITPPPALKTAPVRVAVARPACKFPKQPWRCAPAGW